MLRKHFTGWLNVSIVEVGHAKLPDLCHWLSFVLEQVFVLKFVIEAIKLPHATLASVALQYQNQANLPS